MPGPLTRWSLLVSLALAVVPSIAGCEGCSTAEPTVPAGISVAVNIGGSESVAIDSAALQASKPDFESDDHRAWRLTSLLGERFQPKTMAVELEDEDGRRTMLRRAGAAQSKVVVVVVNRAGSPTVALVAADKPFPAHHGRGGNRGKAGNKGRVKNVKRIWLRTEKPKAKPSGPAFTVQVEVEGGEPLSWTQDDLDKVKQLSFTPGDGEGRRSAWSLRALATKLVGEGAAFVEVTGEGSKGVKISAAHWKDESRLPLLRVNRRGLLKFVWVSSDMSPLEGETAVRRVQKLSVTR
jgi:hypothetical protein